MSKKIKITHNNKGFASQKLVISSAKTVGINIKPSSNVNLDKKAKKTFKIHRFIDYTPLQKEKNFSDEQICYFLLKEFDKEKENYVETVAEVLDIFYEKFPEVISKNFPEYLPLPPDPYLEELGYDEWGLI